MKRGRHFVTVEMDAGDEEELAVLEANVASVTRSLHVAGLIAREDSGLAARHLFKMAEPVAGVPVAPAPPAARVPGSCGGTRDNAQRNVPERHVARRARRRRHGSFLVASK